MKPTGKQIAQAGRLLLAHANTMPVPYVLNGHGLGGMDCQGLAEYLLTQCGYLYSEINLSGSNAHYRDCIWTGTPEECVRVFGTVPEGAWIFIVAHDGGEPAKYRSDGKGNASHMGAYLGGGEAIHASQSRGKVAMSRFEGKTIKNGGWNMVGLPKWVDYGLEGETQANAQAAGEAVQEGVSKVPEDVSRFYTVRRGCLGGAVRRLQEWLTDAGYDIGQSGIDGDFGRATEAALRKFQHERGLQVDGICGQRTWGELAWIRAKGTKA